MAPPQPNRVTVTAYSRMEEPWRRGLRFSEPSCAAVGWTKCAANAEIAMKGMRPGSGIRSGAILIEAVSYVLEGDMERAEPLLARTVDIATHSGSIPAAMNAHSEQALVAMSRGDWPEYERSAAQALSLVQAGRLDDYADSALAYAVFAGAALHRGDAEEARGSLTNAVRLQPSSRM